MPDFRLIGDVVFYFGYLAPFAGLDNPISNVRTRALLGWQPEHIGFLEDIQHGGYLTAKP